MLTWSSQKWKSDEVMEIRMVRLVNEQAHHLFAEHTDRFVIDDDEMDSNTVAESDMSLKSILHRVNDRIRKMLDQSSKEVTQTSVFMQRNIQKIHAPSTTQGTISQRYRCSII